MKKANILWTVLAALVLGVASAVADVIVIANPSVSEASLSSREIRDIFLGNRSRLSSGSITPVLLREGATHEAFLSAYIGRSPVQFQTHWRNIVFTGKGKALASYDSEAEVVEYVSQTAGAIAYIEASTPHDGVKLITVD